MLHGKMQIRERNKTTINNLKQGLFTLCVVVGPLIHVSVRDPPRQRRKGRMAPDVGPPHVPNEVLHSGNRLIRRLVSR